MELNPEAAVTADQPSLTRLALLSVLVVTTSTQPVFLLGAAFPLMGPEFALNAFDLGVLTASFFLTASMASAPFSRIVRRFGWQRAMRLNTRISALLMALIAVGARERWAFTVLLVLAAAAYGLANPSANQALADHAPLHRGATIFGIKHAGIPGSTLLAGLAVPVVVLNLGWRAAYVAAAVLALAVSLLVPSGEMPAPVHEDVAEPGQPWKRRDLVGLAVGGGLATLAAVALGSYLVSAAVDLGFSQGGAGWLQFAGSGLSILTRVGLGWLTDRTQTTGMSLMVGLIVAGAAVFYLLPISSGFGFAAAVMIAFSTAWAWPGLMTHVVVNRDRRSAAVASGISQTGIFVGAGLAPLLLGTVIQRWSFDRAFLLVAVSLTLSAIVLVWVGRTAAAVRQK